jgi:hypothetical protein
MLSLALWASIFAFAFERPSGVTHPDSSPETLFDSYGSLSHSLISVKGSGMLLKNISNELFDCKA